MRGYLPTHDPPIDEYRLLVFEALRRSPRPNVFNSVIGVAHSSETVVVLTQAHKPSLAAWIGDEFGIEVSVRNVGPVELAAQGGDSVGASLGRQVTGTLGCLVKDATGTIFGLSCDHVVGHSGGQSVGDDVWSPGKSDGGTHLDKIGTFERGSAIALGGLAANTTDAALVRFAAGTRTSTTIYGIGVPKGTQTVVPYGSAVSKHGRVTGTTHGTFVYTVSLVLPYPGGSALFIDQLGVDGHPGPAFAARGDSGAVVVEHNGDVGGLLFAVAPQSNLAFANPIDEVCAALGIKL